MVEIDSKIYEYKRLRRFEDIASALLRSNHSTFKHISFICNKWKVLSVGFNDIKHPSKLAVYPLGGRHSETDAIGNLYDLNDCYNSTIINIRMNKHSELRNSKPCDVCYNLIVKMGFRKLYYSTNNGFEYIRL